MKVTNMKITDIYPYDKNPRLNDDAVEAVAKSLKEFGSLVEKTVRLDKALQHMEDFDLCTRDGFLRDFDVLEKAMIQARDEMTAELTEECVAGAAKKLEV